MAGRGWLKLFQEFASELRIPSKEVFSDDPRGAPLTLWDSQRRFVTEVCDGLEQGIHSFNCLKSRQLGITTVSLALVDVFWMAMHPNTIGALVTDTEKNRDANRMLIETYVRSVPEDYFGDFRIVKANRQFIQFSNGSRLDLLVAGTKDKGTSWGEGVGYTLAHMTELAAYGSEDALKSFEEALAQQHPNRLFVRESTAKGYNFWRERYYNGLKNPYTERSFFIGWWAAENNVIARSDPRFLQFNYPASGEERERVVAVEHLYKHKITPEQLAWIRWKGEQAGGDDDDMLQQNQPWVAEQAFIVSGFSFFQTRSIAKDLKEIWDNPDQYQYQGFVYSLGNSFFDMRLEAAETQDEIELKVWEEPVPEGQYVIGMDPAWGRNDWGDRSVISVWRCFADCMVQVAEYATADHDISNSAWACAHLAGAYENCLINLEVSGGAGHVVMKEWAHVRELMNSQFAPAKSGERQWSDALSQARWYLYSRPDSMGKGFAANFETTGKSKESLMFGFRSDYIRAAVRVASVRLLEEMRIVVQNGREIGAPQSSGENSKDDRVIAAALAHRAWIDWVRPGMLAEGLTYDRVMAEERGESTKAMQSVNGIVFRFLKTQEEIAVEGPRNIPTWREEMGLE